MDSFSSFLELMAAINFAYVWGEDFMKRVLVNGIDKRINVKIEDKITELEAICDTITQKSAEENKEKKEKSVEKINQDVISPLFNLKQSYKLDSKQSIPYGFPQLCLISGILCVYSLLLIGLCDSNLFQLSKLYFIICHCVFSFIIMIVYLFFFGITLIEDLNKWAVNSKHFLAINFKISSIFIVLFFLTHLGICYFPSMDLKLLFKIKYEFNYTPLSFMLIIILPVLHFMVVLLLASYTGKQYYSRFEKDFLAINNYYQNEIRKNDDVIEAADARFKNSNSSSHYDIKENTDTI